MKQGKPLTRTQKEIVSSHYLNAKEWSLVFETEFYLKIVHKASGEKRIIDKFRKSKR